MWIFAHVNDAAADHYIQPTLPRLLDQFSTFRTGIQPQFTDCLGCDVVNDSDPDMGRDIHADAVKPCQRNVCHSRIGAHAFDDLSSRMNGKDFESLSKVCAHGPVAELVSVVAGADDRDGWFHDEPI